MNETLSIQFENYCVKRNFSAAQRAERQQRILWRLGQLRKMGKTAMAGMIARYYDVDAKSLRGANRQAMVNAIVGAEYFGASTL